MKFKVVLFFFAVCGGLLAANSDNGWTSWSAQATGNAIVGVSSLADTSGDIDSADEVTPELQSLADALGRDPLRIYEWILNNVDYFPYNGLKRGAHLTYIEKAGNDFDSCALLSALLHASGYNNTKYKFGMLWIPLERADHQDATTWLSADKAYVKNMLIGAGSNYGVFPSIDYDGDMTHIRKPHVWLELVIGPKTYILNPSFKNYKRTAPVPLSSPDVANYSVSDVLSAAGGDYSLDYKYTIGSTGLANLRAKLADYTTKLVSYAYDVEHATSTAEIMGLRELQQNVISGLPESLPAGFSIDSSVAPFEWLKIPRDYAARLIVQLGTAPNISLNKTLYLSDLKGEKITIWFDATGLAKLYVGDGDVPVAEEADGPWKASAAPITYIQEFNNPLG
ncbi:MAG: hypothetical protein QM760_14800 [Nibricoccus sp.]